jgi:hypothetical protein
MDELISINRRGVFNLEQARQILPIVRRITEEISVRVDDHISEIERTPQHEKRQIVVLEDKINQLISHWNEKIKKLGAIPKSLWLVDFDFGRGYYSWKYPEPDILFWRTREKGASVRRPLEELAFETNSEAKNEESAHRPGSNQLPPRGL